MLRILGGLLKGLKIQVPKTDIVRPSSVLLRRRIFDANQNLTGLTFVDLCAGSGTMGIEAWSRGASKVVLVEPNQLVFKTIQENLATIKRGHSEELNVRPIEALNMKAESFLENLGNEQDKELRNWVFFLDPPYKNLNLYQWVFNFFNGSGLPITLWCEGEKGPFAESPAFKKASKVYRHGHKFIIVIDDYGEHFNDTST